MTAQRGLIDNVVQTPLGTALVADAAAGATVLEVDWTAEFPPEGGMLMLADTALPYTSATDADAEVSLIVLTDPLSDVVEAGEPVLSLTSAGEPRSSVVAYVALDEGEDPMPFGVPSALQGKITESTPLGTPVLVDLTTGLVVGRDNTPVFSAATELETVDPETGDTTGGVSPQGDATYRDLTLTGQLLTGGAQYVDLDGQSLADALSGFPRGRLVWLNRTFDTPLATDTAKKHLYSIALDLAEDRGIDFLHEATFESTTTPDLRYTVYCHHTYTEDDTEPPEPTTSDELLFTFAKTTSGTANADNGHADVIARELPAGRHKFGFYFATFGAGNLIQAIYTHRVTLNDQGPALGADSGYWDDTSGVDTPDAQTFVKTYNATATKWYEGNGSGRGENDGQYFGRSSEQPGEGLRKSVIWFPKSTIVADLAGAAVTRVELYLYLFDGGRGNTVAIGSHLDTSPGDNQYSNVASPDRQRQTETNWSAGSGRWVPIGFALSGWATPGSIAGFVIGPSSATSDSYAAAYRGATHALRPKLRITYRK